MNEQRFPLFSYPQSLPPALRGIVQYVTCTVSVCVSVFVAGELFNTADGAGRHRRNKQTNKQKKVPEKAAVLVRA